MDAISKHFKEHFEKNPNALVLLAGCGVGLAVCAGSVMMAGTKPPSNRRPELESGWGGAYAGNHIVN